MKLIIAGSRTAEPTGHQIDEALTRFGLEDVTQVLCGGARGADTMGFIWAKSRGLVLVKFPAQWTQFGKAAGPIRNQSMAKEADAALVFWDGKSRGTRDMINQMTVLGKPVHVVRTDLR